jgi:hypothetical protein
MPVLLRNWTMTSASAAECARTRVASIHSRTQANHRAQCLGAIYVSGVTLKRCVVAKTAGTPIVIIIIIIIISIIVIIIIVIIIIIIIIIIIGTKQISFL